MNKIDEEIKEKVESSEFTPETLAWMLITDDDCLDVKNGQLLCFSDDSNLSPEQLVEDRFQILLTVYFEMLFGWYKLLHLMQNELDCVETEFKPNINSITLEDLTKEFVEKFKVLGYILYVKELNDDDHYNEEYTNCYCRILLKDSDLDSNYFVMKRHQLDPEKRYTFVRNGKFKLKSSIKRYVAVVKLPKKAFKIYFDGI